jgi:hypothetical protein
MRIGTDGNVGIGTNAPGALLDVRGSVIFNEAAGDYDFRVETDSAYDALFVDASNDSVDIMHHASGKVGFFAATPVTRRSHITNEATSNHSGKTHDGMDTNPTWVAADFGFVNRMNDRLESVLTILEDYGLMATS